MAKPSETDILFVNLTTGETDISLMRNFGLSLDEATDIILKRNELVAVYGEEAFK